MRRYETDYAGAWRGHCITRESAIQAATRHVLLDGYTTATVTDKLTDHIVARVWLGADKKSVFVTTVTQIRKVVK